MLPGLAGRVSTVGKSFVQLQEPEEVDKAVRHKAEAVGFDLADADQWFVNSPG